MYCPDPRYTDEARRDRLQGSVVLQVTIQLDGRATEIQVVKSLRKDLDQRAVETLGTWRFKPALDTEGNPVSATTQVEMNFRLF
jgi:protein TonB